MSTSAWPLLPFDSVKSCPKCLKDFTPYGAAATWFREERVEKSPGNWVVVAPEHLLRSCMRCGYSWDEALALP